VRRLLDKVYNDREKLIDVREDQVEGADVVVVSFGITSRVAGAAIDMARAKGVKVGHLRMIITWPFPASKIAALAEAVKAFVVPELNMGQMVIEVERAVCGKAEVISVPHAGGTVHEPEVILEQIMEAAK
ncbi:MAG: 2-oxoacid:acceptor oxidoreductase subunit alpha, partial [Deltaproteobacteria bacterium]|nr:2-oxoacid:acceptor oxidoreductase subunit alpha [Deltaproteobacteria bacterium]